MIKIEKTEIFGWEAAIRGMRNPKNSWDKSDSGWDSFGGATSYSIGDNDLDLMKRLVKAGSDHRKFMRFITVTCDITAPLYWWKEFDTYKVGTVANSCSTMHKVDAKEFELDGFSHEHLTAGSVVVLEHLIDCLNKNRILFRREKNKDYWWQMIQLLPSSYNQKRTVLLNYEVLRNVYNARKAHKLDEWRDFCKWVESLPYHELITDGGEKNGQE